MKYDNTPSKFIIFCLPCLPCYKIWEALSWRRFEARERRLAVIRELPTQGQELTYRLEYEVDDGPRVAGSQPQSRLMALPLEIRRQIYREFLGGHEIYLSVIAGGYKQTVHQGLRFICLLLSCRQVLVTHSQHLRLSKIVQILRKHRHYL